MARKLLLVCLAALLCAGCCNAGSDAVTDNEIWDLSEYLFSIDTQSLSDLVTIDLQGRTFSSATDDAAPNPLLKVKSAAAKAANRNVELLARLYDKYVPECTVAEKETEVKRQQQNDLLDGLLATPVLTATLDFLASKGLVPTGKSAQKAFMYKLWFSPYARGGRNLGSSAFEHVFLGEIKNGDVSGMHSWLYFHDQEAAGKVNYKGYIKKLGMGQHGTLLKIRFDWEGAKKPVNSLFVGATPELEMSLYTLCFLARPDAQCHVGANNVPFFIQTWTMKLRDGFGTIGSAYPAL